MSDLRVANATIDKEPLIVTNKEMKSGKKYENRLKSKKISLIENEIYLASRFSALSSFKIHKQFTFG